MRPRRRTRRHRLIRRWTCLPQPCSPLTPTAPRPRRPDHLTGVGLAVADLPVAELDVLFSQPYSAIDTLADDLIDLWDDHRSSDPAQRRIGRLLLASGAYLQWIGYGSSLAVECSSNTYLSGAARLTAREEQALARAGFAPPDDDCPNFHLAVDDRSQCANAALSVVAALTAVFGVYVG